MERKFMKRNESVLKLLKEHHYGVLFCWKIRRGLYYDIEPERISQYVQYFWNRFLQFHFKEEELFFDTFPHKVTDKARQEHTTIEKEIQSLNHISILQQSHYLNSIAELMDSHIRFEEEKVFPILDKKLKKGVPEIVLYQIAAHEFPVFEDNFPDEFWTMI